MNELYKGWYVPDSELLLMEKEGRETPRALHSLGSDHRILWFAQGPDSDGDERNARWTVFFCGTPLVSMKTLEGAVQVGDSKKEEEAKSRLRKSVRSSLHDEERSRMTTVTVSDVSRDQKNFVGAKKSLSRLIALGEAGASLSEIFDASLQLTWCRRLMNRLIATNLAKSDGPYHPGSPIRYFAESALSDVLQSDARLAAIIWPRSHSLSPFSDEAQGDEAEEAGNESRDSEPPETSRAEERPALAPGDVSDPSENRQPKGAEPLPSGDPTLEETVAALLQISSALLENVVFIRERVAAIEKEMTELRRYWQ